MATRGHFERAPARSAFGVLCCAAVVLSPAARASAEPPRAALVVTRSAGARDCPDAAALVERVRLTTRFTTLAAGSIERSDTWIQVELARDFDGYRALISAHGRRQGTRALDDIGPSCESLADAITLTLAMLLDPESSALRPAPELPKGNRDPSVNGAAISAATTQPAAERPDARVPVLGAEGTAGIAVGVLASPRPLLEGGVRLRFGEAAFGAGAGYVLPDRTGFGTGLVELDLVYGYVRVCVPVLSHGVFRFEACGGPRAGSLHGSGKNFEERDARGVLWLAAAASAQVYGAIGPSLSWSLRTAALVPLLHQGFSVRRGDAPLRAFETPVLGGALSLGLLAEL